MIGLTAAVAGAILVLHGRTDDAPPPVIAVTAVAQACTVRWSPADTVRTARGWRVRAEELGAAAMDSGWLVVGRLAAETDTLGRIIRVPGAPGEFLRGGVLMPARGTPVIVPTPSDSIMVAPRLAARAPDRAMMVWANVDEMGTRAREVWGAELHRGVWTRAQRVVRDDALQWSPPYQSRMYARGDELRLAIGRAGLRRDSGIVLLRHARGRWSTTPLRAPSAAYVELADLPGDTLLIAYVASEEPDGNTLFAQRLDARGERAGERVRVSPAGSGAVYDPRMMVAHDSIAYLAWSAWPPSPSPSRSSPLARVYVARSDDLGRSWTSFAGAEVELGFPSTLEADVDARGAVHVTLRVYADSVPHPLLLTWDRGSWVSSAPPPVHQGWLVGPPILLPSRDDSLRLLWLSIRAGEFERDPGVLLTSVGIRACAGTPTPPRSGG